MEVVRSQWVCSKNRGQVYCRLQSFLDSGAGPGVRLGNLSGPEAPQQLKGLDLPADLLS